MRYYINLTNFNKKGKKMISITPSLQKVKKILNFIVITGLLTSTTINLFAKEQKNHQQKSKNQIILFTAEDGSTGRYWPSEKIAILGEQEYRKVVAINTKELNLKWAQKLKKHKDYLGSFVDKKFQKTFHIYGIIKNPSPVDESPDADVLTEIAIKIDYGPGE